MTALTFCRYGTRTGSSFLLAHNLVPMKYNPVKTTMLTSRQMTTNAISYNKIGPMGVFLMSVPIATFCLGTWQVKRLQWKKALIAELNLKTQSPPQAFPNDLQEIEDLEYYKLNIRGTFDHSREMYIGPRPLLVKGDVKHSGGSMMSSGQSGYHVITPFKLEDRDLTILVNRGWVSRRQWDPSKRQEGQVEGPVALSGIVRKTEKRAPFMPDHIQGAKALNYRDIPQMAFMANTAPIFLDAVETEPHGPLGGQTRVNLRNEHVSYILTWYSLSAITSFLWYRRFILGKSLM